MARPPESEIDRAVDGFRRRLLRDEARAASAMVRAYTDSWRQIKAELDKLEQDYGKVEAGKLSSLNWTYKANKYADMIPLVEKQLTRFSQFATRKVTDEQFRAIRNSSNFAKDLLQAGLTGFGGEIPDVLKIRSLPYKRIEAIVGINQPNSPLTALFNSIVQNGAQDASRILVDASLMGWNPRKAAPMLRDALGIQLTRALTISRTEIMRASRIAAGETYKENAGVVKGWRWQASMTGNTCPICMIMHGTEHDLSEKLDSHPNCRCIQTPITMTWEELGEKYGIDMTGIKPDEKAFAKVADKYNLSETQRKMRQFAGMQGQDYIKTLPDEKQIALLGPARWTAWRGGIKPLPEMINTTYSPVWGSGLKLAPIVEMFGGNAGNIYADLGKSYLSHILEAKSKQDALDAWESEMKERYRQSNINISDLIRDIRRSIKP